MKSVGTSFIKNWVSAFIAPRQLIGIAHFPRFIRDWFRYSRLSRKNIGSGRVRIIDSHPCLTDWIPYTPFDAHYFFQGAWLARRLGSQKPGLHVDIASSVLTIGTVSAQVDTVFVDYRPIRANLKGMTPVAGNIVNLPFASDSLISLSCLHVIEHIGLGRYGDPIDPEGSIKAAHELQRVLKEGGLLYLSVPVGRERIEFNAHRVFDPEKLLDLFGQMKLAEFSYVDDSGFFHENRNPVDSGKNQYACGMYIFRK